MLSLLMLAVLAVLALIALFVAFIVGLWLIAVFLEHPIAFTLIVLLVVWIV